MTTVTCDKCGGTGEIKVMSPTCDTELLVGNETFECWADRAHVGYPHARMLVSPCYACGAFEEHDETCGVYDMEPWTGGADEWWMWSDGDLAPHRVLELCDALAWKAMFMNNRKVAA